MPLPPVPLRASFRSLVTFLGGVSDSPLDRRAERDPPTTPTVPISLPPTKPPQKRHWQVAFEPTKNNPKSPFRNSLNSESYSRYSCESCLLRQRSLGRQLELFARDDCPDVAQRPFPAPGLQPSPRPMEHVAGMLVINARRRIRKTYGGGLTDAPSH